LIFSDAIAIIFAIFHFEEILPSSPLFDAIAHFRPFAFMPADFPPATLIFSPPLPSISPYY